MFVSFNHQFTSPIANLATTLGLMLSPCGILYPIIFKQHSLLPHLGEGSKHTSTTRHTPHSLHQYTPLSSVVGDPCYVPGHEYQIIFCLLHLRVCSLAEIKCYKSRIRIMSQKLNQQNTEPEECSSRVS